MTLKTYDSAGEDSMDLRGRFFLENGEKVDYDFEEDHQFQSGDLKEEKRRPPRPMTFQWKEHVIEIHYEKGLYPYMDCSCSPDENSLQQSCVGIERLKESFFPQMLVEIFSQCGENYNRQYLQHDVAQKIRLIHPASERSIIEKMTGKLKGEK